MCDGCAASGLGSPLRGRWLVTDAAARLPIGWHMSGTRQWRHWRWMVTDGHHSVNICVTCSQTGPDTGHMQSLWSASWTTWTSSWLQTESRTLGWPMGDQQPLISYYYHQLFRLSISMRKRIPSDSLLLWITCSHDSIMLVMLVPVSHDIIVTIFIVVSPLSVVVCCVIRCAPHCPSHPLLPETAL